VQLGGSDQWGNIVSGIDMIKREQAAAARETEADKKKAKGVTEAQRDPAFGLTMPLLTTSSGEKFGKSAGNAVWLDQNRTSVFDFYQVSNHARKRSPQFFVRTPDDDVAKYLLILTLVPPAEIANVMEAHAANPKARAPQKLLAREVTELVHGRE
jgi:tyrosyl-tRNA synthetase